MDLEFRKAVSNAVTHSEIPAHDKLILLLFAVFFTVFMEAARRDSKDLAEDARASKLLAAHFFGCIAVIFLAFFILALLLG